MNVDTYVESRINGEKVFLSSHYETTVSELPTNQKQQPYACLRRITSSMDRMAVRYKMIFSTEIQTLEREINDFVSQNVGYRVISVLVTGDGYVATLENEN